MASCTQCKAAIPDETKFCAKCGASTETTLVPPPPPPMLLPGRATPEQRYFVTWGAGERGGPFSEDEIKLLISQQRLKITDAIIAEGASQWMPISQSKFASFVIQHAQITRLASSTCPMCGAAMAVILKRSSLGLTLIIAGVVLTPLCGLGIPLWIVGYSMRFGKKGTAAYRCPRCNHES